MKFLLPVTDIGAAREAATRGDRDTAIREIRQAVDDTREGYLFYRVWGTGVLVETLLERGADCDRPEALELVGRYTARAESLGFEGHIDWAQEMTRHRQ
ncbi:hypothetical protein [Mycolicibacterium gadium]|uniref:hypothetical protein n=1 Tax=Mycolicibacterium gadium TaxID=1794 RepID=UPI002FDE95C6